MLVQCSVAQDIIVQNSTLEHFGNQCNEYGNSPVVTYSETIINHNVDTINIVQDSI